MKSKKERDKIDLGILKVLNYFMIANVIACAILLAIFKLTEWGLL